MVDPKTIQVIVAGVHKLVKSKSFRYIAAGAVLMAALIPMIAVFAIGSIAGIPSAVFGWGNGTGDYSGGDTKTLRQYAAMVQNFQTAVNDKHEKMLTTIRRDADRHGYVLQGNVPAASSGTASATSSDPNAPPPKPKDQYRIDDQYGSAGLTGAADFAISAYSLRAGGNAVMTGFQQTVAAHAGSYLTYDKTSEPQADGSKLYTYTVRFLPSAGETAFGLSGDETAHVSQLAVNLRLLVAGLTGDYSNVTITAGLGDNGMGVSDSLITFIEKWEGYIPNWYDDGYGTPTIGYGHIEPLPAGFSEPLSQTSAEALLKADLPSYIASVRKAFAGTTLKQSQFDALVSLCYNLGPNIWKKISLTQDIQNGAPAVVIQRDFEALDRVNGSESDGLLNRREAEYQVFQNGVYSY